jgi:hypothetical protein
MIDREIIQDMFDDIRAKGKWNVDGPLLWGYFFTARQKLPLEKVAQILVKGGYRLVDIWQTAADGSEGADVWWLHAERVEKHTVNSLMARNAELDALAVKYKLESYDGMDVGPAEK